MCLFLPLKVLFFAMAIAAWQSQCIDTKGVSFIPKGISAKRFLNYSTSLSANSRATNSVSMVDLAIIVCLVDFQVTAPPPKVNTYPLVDFVSFESEIQLASPYPSNTAEIHYIKYHYSWFLSNISLICSK